jgi:hypothetical protein
MVELPYYLVYPDSDANTRVKTGEGKGKQERQLQEQKPDPASYLNGYDIEEITG